MNANQQKKDNRIDLIWFEALKRATVWMLCTVGVLVLFGRIMERLETMVNAKLYSTMGSDAVLFTAFLGTPVHECAHLIVARIFNFEIAEVQLLKPRTYKQDGVLGYVYYASDDSIISQIGNFFVGIAPLLLGSFFILLAVRVFIPEVYKEADTRCDAVWLKYGRHKTIRSTLAFVKGLIVGLTKLRLGGFVRLVLCLYVTTSISMHMTYSPVDMENGMTGFFILFIIFYIYGLISAIIKARYFGEAIEIAVLLSIIFLTGVACDFILLGVAGLFI